MARTNSAEVGLDGQPRHPTDMNFKSKKSPQLRFSVSKVFWISLLMVSAVVSRVWIANISLAAACSNMLTLEICKISFMLFLIPFRFFNIATNK